MNLTRGIKTIAGTSRPPFLILSIICVFSGFAAVFYDGYKINYVHLILVFTGALAAHICVNVLNEYFDFKSGLDLQTMRTPFSGGSGTLPNHPVLLNAALFLGIGSALAVIFTGIYFFMVRGPVILIPLVPGLLAMLLYSPILVKVPVLCLVAPGIGFGISMVAGTSIALSGSMSVTANLLSLIPFFLVSNLLLLNQYPDIVADKNFKRNNILIAYGIGSGIFIYNLFTVLTIITILASVYFNIFPKIAVAGIIPALYSLLKMVGFKNYYKNNPLLVRQLKVNVLTVLVTPLLVSLTLFIQ